MLGEERPAKHQHPQHARRTSSLMLSDRRASAVLSPVPWSHKLATCRISVRAFVTPSSVRWICPMRFARSSTMASRLSSDVTGGSCDWMHGFTCGEATPPACAHLSSQPALTHSLKAHPQAHPRPYPCQPSLHVGRSAHLVRTGPRGADPRGSERWPLQHRLHQARLWRSHTPSHDNHAYTLRP